MSPGKREIGDALEQVVRTGKLGSASGGQPAGSPAIQVSSSPEVQTSSTLSFQKSSSLDAQKSGSPETQSASSPEVQKSSNVATQIAGSPEVLTASSSEGKRVQRTIYLSPALAKWVKIRAAIEEREISELAEDAFLLYRQHIERGNNGH